MKNKPTIIFTIVTLILIDQITKLVFTNKTYFFKNSPIFIHYSENIGSSFSLFSSIPNYNLFIILLSCIVILLIFIILKNHKEVLRNKYFTLSFIFFTSGVIGNLLDRIFLEYVRDFIAVRHLFIFNFADLYLNISVIIFLIYEIKTKLLRKTPLKQSKNQ